MSVKTAEEIMIQLDEYPHIPSTFTLRQAMIEFEKWELDICGKKSLPRAVLVFDEDHRLIGTARRRDILRGLEPRFLTGVQSEHQKKLFDVKIDPNISEFSYEKLIKHMKEHTEHPIKEVMTPISAVVDHKDHLLKIVNELVEKNASLLPVLKDGRVVGVVRSVDVFHEMVNLLL